MAKVCKSTTIKYRNFFKGMAKCEKWRKKMEKKKKMYTLELVFDITTEKVELELI